MVKHRRLRTASRSLTNKPQNRCICARRKRHLTIGFESQNTAAYKPYSDRCPPRHGTGRSKGVFTPDGGIPNWLRIAENRRLRSDSDLCQPRRGSGTSEVCCHPKVGIPNWLRIAKRRSLRSVVRSLQTLPPNRHIRSVSSPRWRNSELASNRKTSPPAICIPIFANLATEPRHWKYVFTPMAEFRMALNGKTSQATDRISLFNKLTIEPMHHGTTKATFEISFEPQNTAPYGPHLAL